MTDIDSEKEQKLDELNELLKKYIIDDTDKEKQELKRKADIVTTNFLHIKLDDMSLESIVNLDKNAWKSFKLNQEKGIYISQSIFNILCGFALIDKIVWRSAVKATYLRIGYKSAKRTNKLCTRKTCKSSK